MAIHPRNREQRFAMDALLDPDIKLVTIAGKAGTGKTLLAIAAGLDMVLSEQLYRKLLVARPVVPMGRDLGFLPGELEEKLRRDFPAEAAKLAADRMEELGLLDDAACGRQLAAELLGRKGFSSSRARLELCRKGVDPALAEEIVEELAPPPEEKIRQLLEKKYPLAARDEKQRRRAVNALQRMGYRLPEIRQALRCLDETIELDEEQIWQ